MTRKELIYAWIEALESGEYQQTRSCLGEIDEKGDMVNCCLGVACEVGTKLGLIKKREVENQNELGEADIVYDGVSSLLPSVMVNALGFTANDGQCIAKIENLSDDHISLVVLNDQVKYNFNQIAEFIKTNLEKGNTNDLFIENVNMDEEISIN